MAAGVARQATIFFFEPPVAGVGHVLNWTSPNYGERYSKSPKQDIY